MSCCNFICKYFLFIFNFLCVILGFGLIIIGSLFLCSGSELHSYDTFDPAVRPILTIVLGCVICVVSFFGCCGAFIENRCMLTTYTIFLIILSILQIVFSTFVLSTMYRAEVYVGRAWTNRKQKPEIFDAIQIVGRCCGEYNRLDYGIDPLPASCCGHEDENDKCYAMHAYDTGCFYGFRNYFRSYANWIIVYGYIIAAIELAGVILACCLKGTLNRHRGNMKR